MKLNFQQRTIENKIKIFDSLITTWVQMRNLLVHQRNNPKWLEELDKIYGNSQRYLGEAMLVSKNVDLILNIEVFNEKFYRSDWSKLSREDTNKKLEELKKEARELIPRMRNDIQESTGIFSIFRK